MRCKQKRAQIPKWKQVAKEMCPLVKNQVAKCGVMALLQQQCSREPDSQILSVRSERALRTRSNSLHAKQCFISGSNHHLGNGCAFCLSGITDASTGTGTDPFVVSSVAALQCTNKAARLTALCPRLPSVWVASFKLGNAPTLAINTCSMACCWHFGCSLGNGCAVCLFGCDLLGVVTGAK